MQFGPSDACLHLARGVQQLLAQRRAGGTDLVEAATDHVHERHAPGRRADTSAQRAAGTPTRR